MSSDQATHLERLPLWPLCQREAKVPGLYKKHTATQPFMPEITVRGLTRSRMLTNQIYLAITATGSAKLGNQG